MLSEEERHEIMKEAAMFPHPEAACVEALKVVQSHRGWVSDEGIRDVADILGMPAEDVDGVATFYTRIYRKPVGRNVILLCDGAGCMIAGYESLYSYISSRLSVRFGETTGDGRFTLLPVSCLGRCDRSPCMMINDDTYDQLTIGDIETVLDKYR